MLRGIQSISDKFPKIATELQNQGLELFHQTNKALDTRLRPQRDVAQVRNTFAPNTTEIPTQTQLELLLELCVHEAQKGTCSDRDIIAYADGR